MSEYRQAICPVCGRAAGYQVTERVPGKPYMVWKRENYWEKIRGFDPDKPFGVIQDVSQGRGKSFGVIGYFGPEEDTDGFFPLVKERLLAAVTEWVNKEWITKEEVLKAIGEERG